MDTPDHTTDNTASDDEAANMTWTPTDGTPPPLDADQADWLYTDTTSDTTTPTRRTRMSPPELDAEDAEWLFTPTEPIDLNALQRLPRR